MIGAKRYAMTQENRIELKLPNIELYPECDECIPDCVCKIMLEDGTLICVLIAG